MDQQSPKSVKSQMRLVFLLPNLLTISAICAGLTAIRFGYEGNYELAVYLVLAACVLDGLDGRLARLMNRTTEVGAELDSLADFLNFGVAPVLILYHWALQETPRVGWIAVLIYAICCVLRLARFNVSNRTPNKDGTDAKFFVGVPSPAGAVLVMFPMVFSFAVTGLPHAPPTLVAAHICLIGLMMISRVPTYSFKGMTIDRANAKFYLLGAVCLVAALFTFLWATLTLMSIAYVGCLVAAYRSFRKARKKDR